MPGVVIVVVPLRAVFSVRRIGQRIEQARAVVVILQHEVDQPSGGGGEIPDRSTEVMQDRWLPVSKSVWTASSRRPSKR